MALPIIYKKAFKAVWAIFTVTGIIMLLVAVFVPPKAVLAASPVCYSVKQFGRQCFMCGSTRSFIQAGSGNFAAAARYNRLALALFFALIINACIFIYFKITNNSITK